MPFMGKGPKRGFRRRPSQEELDGPMSKEEAEDATVEKEVYDEGPQGPDDREPHHEED